MESTRPSVFVKNNEEGVDRVIKMKKKYAFLMESTAIEYELERNCNLMQIGSTLDSKGYGIAMPFGTKRNVIVFNAETLNKNHVIPFYIYLCLYVLDSSYRTAVDNAVLKLAESGKLVEFKNRWWKVPKELACVVSFYFC